MPIEVLNHYIEGMHSTNDAATKFFYYRVTFDPNKEKLDMARYTKQYRMFAKATIPVTPTETIYMHLGIKINETQKYKMQYRDNHSGLNIRCDNAHGKPHIDIEWPGEKQKKEWLTEIPNNYEEAINLILMNAEQNNPVIGALYWIMPSLYSNYDDKVNQLEQLKFSLGINTSLTIVARAVQVKLLSEEIKRKERKLSPLTNQEIIELFKDECRKIAELEGDGGALEIKEVTYRNDIVAFPFTIRGPPGSHFDYEDYPFTGNVTKNNLVGFEYEL